jgi:hypothetical protein
MKVYSHYGEQMFGKKKLIAENERLKEWVKELSRNLDVKEIGVLTVDVPLNLGKEQTDKVLDMVRQVVDAEMERLNIEMDWIIMPSIVKSVQTIVINVKENDK